MVQSKSDRERQKLITDKCQALIEVLLKDDDNKYCVDCDAKGPRWASWNLGIFLCIRCAGIHRNLGVHISRVKSVNLDAWAPDHVAYVQRMGNSRARAIYEANLPDDFRRPQTDTALESFIRAKYEHKKYIAQDYVDPGPPEPAFNVDEELKRMKEQKRSKLTGGNNKTILSVSDSFAASTMAAAPANQASSTAIQNAKPSLATNSVSKPRVLSSELGILSQKQQQSPQMLHNDIQSNSGTKPKSALADLIDLDLGFGAQPSSNITNKFDLNNPINSNSNFNSNSAFEFGQLFAAIPQVQDSQQRQHQHPSNIASLANFVSTASISAPSSASTVAPTMLIPSAIGTSKTPTPKPSTDSPANNLMGGSAGKNVFDLLDL